jgi:septum formation protein
VVHLDGEIFGKPTDVEHAARMLRALSGREHRVTSAFALRVGDALITRAVTTKVRFRALSDAEIVGYVATGEPMDKAGAYGIQGVGGFLVATIDGQLL